MAAVPLAALPVMKRVAASPVAAWRWRRGPARGCRLPGGTVVVLLPLLLLLAAVALGRRRLQRRVVPLVVVWRKGGVNHCLWLLGLVPPAHTGGLGGGRPRNWSWSGKRGCAERSDLARIPRILHRWCDLRHAAARRGPKPALTRMAGGHRGRACFWLERKLFDASVPCAGVTSRCGVT
jgi:hypothetical protein